MARREPSVVVFSGGGTGGHFYPALALARELAALRPDVRPFFVGSRRGVEARVLPDCDIDYSLVEVAGLDRRHLWNNAMVMQSLLGSVLDVFETFRRLRPALVVVTGGYACAPSGLVAACMGIPLALQEQNSLPGVTTRLLSCHASQIHLAYPEAEQAIRRRARPRVVVSGNPVRAPEGTRRGEARRRFGLAAKGRVVLVVGGSQGSAALNRLVADGIMGAALGALDRPEQFQLLWASGPAHYSEISQELSRAGSPDWVRLVPYIHDMPTALAAADLAVSRAGAMATSEFLVHGLPAILIPLPTSAEDHQMRNAAALAEAGVALLVPESEADARALWSDMVGLAGDDRRVASMARAARERSEPAAAAKIAAALTELLPRAPGSVNVSGEAA
jgi:UDP-N-acetylglucosamine--N-acetylmuramyl-(pentapeptide) pyrophosphoryl-undecaprenol N-acetylglucosamine transferase